MEDQELNEQQNRETFLKGENAMMDLHIFAVRCRSPAASGFLPDLEQPRGF